MKHRIDNNEMNPKTECGLEVDGMARSHTLALANEVPTCEECLNIEKGERDAGRTEPL